MDNIWLESALWIALALVAALGSIWITISAALFEIVVGAIAGNTIGLPLTPWINYIASVGAVVLTFLAGTDIDPHVVKRNLGSSVTIGVMGFFAPYLGCLLLARYGLGWPWPQAQIAGIALSTTSVAVVYASIAFINAGQLRPLAVTTRTVLDVLPNVPPMNDFVTGYETKFWLGIGAPRATPIEVIATLNKEINAALNDPKVRSQLASMGDTPIPMTPDQFGALIAEDVRKWAEVIKFADIKAE